MSLLLNDYQVGAHMPFTGKIYDTVYESINMGMYTTQFFMGNPYGFERTKISIDDIESTKNLIKRYPIDIFTHYPYIANLAGSKDSLAWSGDTKQDNKTMKILKSLEYELGVLSNFNRNGVVIHPGNFKDRNKGLTAIYQSINKINFPTNSKLILENSAGQGTSLATTFQEIKMLIDNIEENKRSHIGVCIDTCHTYAYGLYDLSILQEVEKMFLDFDNILGIDKLSLIHLNDSKEKYASKKDRHELLKQGCIWKQKDDSLKYLIQHCKKLNIPCILETEKTDMITVVNLF
jgi:deoxyribonuclease-4